MSELVNNAKKRKALLKHMILQLHKGEAPEEIKKQLMRLLGDIPYGEVVEVEQELISEGLPTEEVLELCDVHTEVLKGHIDQSGEEPVPPGHPVHTFSRRIAHSSGHSVLQKRSLIKLMHFPIARMQQVLCWRSELTLTH